MQEFPDALDYDCMTLTGRSLDEWADMGPRGLVALAHLVRHLRPDSATWPLMNGDEEAPAWTLPAKTNTILADIYDQLQALRAEHAAKGTGKRPRRMTPYPRPTPGGKRPGIGTADMTAGDFDAWWQSAGQTT